MSGVRVQFVGGPQDGREMVVPAELLGTGVRTAEPTNLLDWSSANDLAPVTLVETVWRPDGSRSVTGAWRLRPHR